MNKLITAIVILFLLPLSASAAVYRCNVGGKVVFTDVPCNPDAQTYMDSSRNPAETPNEQTQNPDTTQRDARVELTRMETRFFVLHDEVVRMEREYQEIDAEHQYELNKIRTKQRRAANNLAGATWLNSLAQEMQAITARYAPRLERLQNDIERKKRERDDLKDEIDTIKGLR